jgi:hypothetical protein
MSGYWPSTGWPGVNTTSIDSNPLTMLAGKGLAIASGTKILRTADRSAQSG